MATTYKYTVELSEPMYPRFLADCMVMQGNLARSLVSVTDLQRSDHVYGATYQVRDEQDQEAPQEQAIDMTKREAIDTLRRYLPPDLLRQVLQALEAEPTIANIATSAGDTDIDEWLEREEEMENEEAGAVSGLHQCQYCYNLVNEEHEEFCRLNPNRNRNIVP